MGISVTSIPPKGIGPATPLSNNASTESLPGDFAALLSGELFNIKGLVLGESGKSLATTEQEKDTKLTKEDSTGASTGLLDPSLLASLVGNPAVQPEIPRHETLVLPTGNEKLEKRIAEANINPLNANANNPEQSSSISTNIETFGAMEKQALAGLRQGQNGTLGYEAANIAAESTPLNTNTSILNGSANMNATVMPSQDARAAETENINTHLRESGWSQQFGEKIVWLAKNNLQSAQININPPELGPVQITLNLSGDQIKVAFASPHAEVRQAIEGALPQLKEMLSSAGINLGQANVGANLNQQSTDNPYQTPNGKRFADENAILPANDSVQSNRTNTVLQKGRGLVDLFA